MGRLLLGATVAGANSLCTNVATDPDPSVPIVPGVLPPSIASAGYFPKPLRQRKEETRIREIQLSPSALL